MPDDIAKHSSKTEKGVVKPGKCIEEGIELNLPQPPATFLNRL
jgi:hypothetical protein